MDVVITKVLDLGNDKLQIIGTIDEKEVTAFGWLSAMSNHYDLETYLESGHRMEGAQPREMTREEKLAYCKRLLVEQNPIPKELELF